MNAATEIGRDWLSAYTAKLRELHNGRDWPFAVGDLVTARGNWGVLCGELRAHAERNPGAVYTVSDVRDGGRWLALQAETGEPFFAEPWSGIGPGYFRIAGECGNHFAQYREGVYPGIYECARCDQVMPEVTEILRREVPGD